MPTQHFGHYDKNNALLFIIILVEYTIMETKQLVQKIYQERLSHDKNLNSLSEEDVLKLEWSDYVKYHILIGKAVAEKKVEKYVAY